jgi:hypothetical protein
MQERRPAPAGLLVVLAAPHLRRRCSWSNEQPPVRRLRAGRVSPCRQPAERSASSARTRVETPRRARACAPHSSRACATRRTGERRSWPRSSRTPGGRTRRSPRRRSAPTPSPQPQKRLMASNAISFGGCSPSRTHSPCSGRSASRNDFGPPRRDRRARPPERRGEPLRPGAKSEEAAQRMALPDRVDEVDGDGRRIGVRYAAGDDPMLDSRGVELWHETVDPHREPSVPTGRRAVSMTTPVDHGAIGDGTVVVAASVSVGLGQPARPEGRGTTAGHRPPTPRSRLRRWCRSRSSRPPLPPLSPPRCGRE